MKCSKYASACRFINCAECCWWSKLKSSRKDKNLSLRDVEKLTGISNAYINQLENGFVKEPGYFKMIKLLKLYEIEHLF